MTATITESYERGAERLDDLLPALLEFVFVSYFGAEQANRPARAR
jgi:hypothetical protein